MALVSSGIARTEAAEAAEGGLGPGLSGTAPDERSDDEDDDVRGGEENEDGPTKRWWLERLVVGRSR